MAGPQEEKLRQYLAPARRWTVFLAQEQWRRGADRLRDVATAIEEARPLAERNLGDTTAEAADIAFLGIGTPTQGSSAAILDSLNLTEDERDDFWAHEPAGDVAARYYNADGAPIRGAVDDRVLGISLEGLLEIPNVVGVASGRAKTPGVLGALRGRIIDSLVCDEALARSVLSAAGTSTGGT